MYALVLQKPGFFIFFFFSPPSKMEAVDTLERIVRGKKINSSGKKNKEIEVLVLTAFHSSSYFMYLIALLFKLIIQTPR